MNDKIMAELLKNVKSALAKLDDRVQNLEIDSNRKMGSISEELDVISCLIAILDNYYYDE